MPTACWSYQMGTRGPEPPSRERSCETSSPPCSMLAEILIAPEFDRNNEYYLVVVQVGGRLYEGSFPDTT